MKRRSVSGSAEKVHKHHRPRGETATARVRERDSAVEDVYVVVLADVDEQGQRTDLNEDRCRRREGEGRDEDRIPGTDVERHQRHDERVAPRGHPERMSDPAKVGEFTVQFAHCGAGNELTVVRDGRNTPDRLTPARGGCKAAAVDLHPRHRRRDDQRENVRAAAEKDDGRATNVRARTGNGSPVVDCLSVMAVAEGSVRLVRATTSTAGTGLFRARSPLLRHRKVLNARRLQRAQAGDRNP